MLNIVIPMAGLGSRFAEVGYALPKPLIPVHGVPMIRLVLENLRPARPHRFIFICQRAHLEQFGLAALLTQWAPESTIVPIDGLTEGAACTVLAAHHIFGSKEPLMIANSDQFVDVDINTYLAEIDARALDGMIMTMAANDPKWSYAALNRDNLVSEVAEKRVISPQATVGIYNFATGAAFVSGAETMIAKNVRVNNEFYVAPVYNELVKSGSRIGIFPIGSEGHGMYGLGIPADLDAFLKLPLSRAVTRDLA